MGLLGKISNPVGSLLNGLTGATDQQSNAQEFAREMYNLQLQASNTAHQREVKDMLAAGLNPVLSASGGHGAAVPSGVSSPVANNSSLGQLASMVGSVVGIGKQLADAANARSAAEATELTNDLRKSFMDRLSDGEKAQIGALMSIPGGSTVVGDAINDLIRAKFLVKPSSSTTGAQADNMFERHRPKGDKFGAEFSQKSFWQELVSKIKKNAYFSNDPYPQSK